MSSRYDLINTQKTERLGTLFTNRQGAVFKVIKYIDTRNVLIEFQDKFHYTKWTNWSNIMKLDIKNPYHKNVFNAGMSGNKYPIVVNGKVTKEYNTWHHMIRRCYDNKYKEKNLAYKDVTCCEEWLLYDNFYEWLHSQENFDKWKNLKGSAIDKDIICKNNVVYSPNNCCLVPQRINSLFTNRKNHRGDLPVGVTLNTGHNITKPYEASVFINGKNKYIGIYKTPEEAFFAYKKTKEKYIKQIAQEELGKGNITQQCYEAMLNYKVEITD